MEQRGKESGIENGREHGTIEEKRGMKKGKTETQGERGQGSRRREEDNERCTITVKQTGKADP